MNFKLCWLISLRKNKIERRFWNAALERRGFALGRGYILLKLTVAKAGNSAARRKSLTAFFSLSPFIIPLASNRDRTKNFWNYWMFAPKGSKPTPSSCGIVCDQISVFFFPNLIHISPNSITNNDRNVNFSPWRFEQNNGWHCVATHWGSFPLLLLPYIINLYNYLIKSSYIISPDPLKGFNQNQSNYMIA